MSVLGFVHANFGNNLINLNLGFTKIFWEMSMKYSVFDLFDVERTQSFHK